MKIFTLLYDKVLTLAEHPKAVRFLGVISFSESIFFPIPTDVMLAPMALAQPEKAWRLALITTITSVLGGLVGYLLGYFLFDSLIADNLVDWGYQDVYLQIKGWFDEYGIWIVFIAGFSPIPYKVFTLTAGGMQMAFVPFGLVSLVSRGARFFLVAGLMRWGGEPMRQKLRQYIDTIGWIVVSIVLIFILYKSFLAGK
jgi:membrane protein YqaA with SNARE-associated domain